MYVGTERLVKLGNENLRPGQCFILPSENTEVLLLGEIKHLDNFEVWIVKTIDKAAVKKCFKPVLNSNVYILNLRFTYMKIYHIY